MRAKIDQTLLAFNNLMFGRVLVVSLFRMTMLGVAHGLTDVRPAGFEPEKQALRVRIWEIFRLSSSLVRIGAGETEYRPNLRLARHFSCRKAADPSSGRLCERNPYHRIGIR